MMRALLARGAARAAERAAAHADALGARAAAELPHDLNVARIADGIAITGAGLTDRLAFDGRLRGLTLGYRQDRP